VSNQEYSIVQLNNLIQHANMSVSLKEVYLHEYLKDLEELTEDGEVDTSRLVKTNIGDQGLAMEFFRKFSSVYLNFTKKWLEHDNDEDSETEAQ
jgi:hypothetical protein